MTNVCSRLYKKMNVGQGISNDEVSFDVRHSLFYMGAIKSAGHTNNMNTFILSAESAKQHSPGRSPGLSMKDAASPERTKQTAVPSFQDSIKNSCLTQGCGCFAAFTLPAGRSFSEASGFAVAHFQCADRHF
jgi:hypothetical protein